VIRRAKGEAAFRSKPVRSQFDLRQLGLGAIKEQLKSVSMLLKKIVLINVLGLAPGRKRMQASHKDYNKSSGRVNWERTALSAGWQVTSRERR
jgi:hypothetical protein